MHLKHSLAAMAVCCGLWASSPAAVNAQAQADGLALAQRKTCMACHQVESRRVGPPLRGVAERYAGQGDAMVPYLAGKIRSGGRGVWGVVPMPAQPQVSEDEANQLAQWISSLSPPPAQPR